MKAPHSLIQGSLSFGSAIHWPHMLYLKNTIAVLHYIYSFRHAMLAEDPLQTDPFHPSSYQSTLTHNMFFAITLFLQHVFLK